jgi:hypothetical protein
MDMNVMRINPCADLPGEVPGVFVPGFDNQGDMSNQGIHDRLSSQIWVGIQEKIPRQKSRFPVLPNKTTRRVYDPKSCNLTLKKLKIFPQAADKVDEGTGQTP